ncbi:related to Protein ERP3 [Saccharomycodes ludwigii]|uniref:Related to Protein ERP3 n=1 Tax=Saccharomycodes ludwigii TaxID=36035 RepID=A0A376BA44_9ASCO|nr:hypothetical protein SCDLUD_002393 [Saccharomycodes ludwigii]KAH3900932.1 hypothetical protein SCDLUD_002393 [Saccharomycodes ludwigii]SSD61546.1 related to Protein ERP3 [Saccharomycodes ludwigii]
MYFKKNIFALLLHTAILHVATVLPSPVTFELLDRECLYTLTPSIDCQIDYYFAVQHGEEGDYDINYEIFGPDGVKLISRTHERQGEWFFNAEFKGEYKFCFESSKKGLGKIIDFDVSYTCQHMKETEQTKLKNMERNKLLNNLENEQQETKLWDMLDDIERQLSLLERNLEYYKTRTKRNNYTVRSTTKRVFWFSIYSIFLTIAIGIGQILMLKFLFNRSRKHRV